MKIKFLGAGEAFDANRHNTSILIDDKILLDCGYSIPQKVWQLNPDKNFLDAIVASHHHADHVAGVPILYMRWFRQEKRTKPIVQIGPTGHKKYFWNLAELFYPSLLPKDSPIEFMEVQNGSELHVQDFKLKFAENDHIIKPSLAVRVEHDGKSICYSGDTVYSKAIAGLAKGCDLLIHEAYLADDNEYHKRIRAHSSPLIAARVASEAGAKGLALVHISRTYIKDKIKILQEAKREYSGDVLIPDDGDEVEV